MQPESSLVHAGFLVKRGHVIKSWKRRWFKLYKNGILEYAKLEGDKPKGDILVAHCKCVPVPVSAFKRQFVCVITSVHGEVLVLQACDNDSRSEWMRWVKPYKAYRIPIRSISTFETKVLGVF